MHVRSECRSSFTDHQQLAAQLNCRKIAMAVPLAAHQLNIQTPAGQLQMQADEPTLLKLRDCLSQTMSPDTATRRAAESALSASEKQPGFAQCVMRLMEVNSAPDQRPVRQAAAILFKNFIKNNYQR